MSRSEPEPLLTLDGVTVRLGGRAVLHDLHLRVTRGEVVAVTGSNGAGKTTLLRVSANLVRPAQGRRIGHPAVAYVPAAIEPPALPAEVWLRGVRKRRTLSPTTLLEQLGFDGHLDRPCRELSFGNLRKLLLAEAFSSTADLVVVDEASEGLDSRGAATLVTLMHDARAQQRSVLFAEQQTQHLVGADRIVSLRSGRVDIEEHAGADAIAVSFRGPASRLDDLTAAAEQLGYRYMVERE
ncbi:MAG TPA: ATP-binding cassette domain-containing protein [Acidimicrobiia bacterium]|jgi:zinc transport system ATP-binding protein